VGDAFDEGSPELFRRIPGRASQSHHTVCASLPVGATVGAGVAVLLAN